jgi:thymidine phosphorylase
MVSVGGRLNWNSPVILDKHCVGGLPGNRTTPLVVAIVASKGLFMPKTSSRAITSPAGTADTIETMTNVDLGFDQIQQVVKDQGGCLAWGGAINLSPADDKLIRIERSLDVDSDGQLVASVLSKKIAAGATHLVLDIPFGPTAKVRSKEHAQDMAKSLLFVANSFGIETRVILSDGAEPVGRGIGPALEAHDVLAVLRNDGTAPQDLLNRATDLAGILLEMSGVAPEGEGKSEALSAIHSGKAYEKFIAICHSQGGFSEPPSAAIQQNIACPENGKLIAIDNRRLAKLAKLLGAPDAKAAGVYLTKKLGSSCRKDETLLTLHAETQGEFDYARTYWLENRDMFEFGEHS